MKTNGNVAGDPVNSPSEKFVRTRSRFPSLSYHFYNTERFGEYNVPFVMDCVEGDKVPLRSGGRVQSYTLKAPLMQSLFKKKDFYMVPMEAILPKNWQKFYTNPVVGDDVPDLCGTTVEDYWSFVRSLVTACFGVAAADLASTPAVAINILNSVLRTAVIGEYFYSAGSLMKSLGCSGHRYAGFVYGNKFYSYDTWFDQLMSVIVSNVPYFEFKNDGHTYCVVNNDTTDDYRRIASPVVDFRTFLQLLRDDLTTFVSAVDSSLSSVLVTVLSGFFDSTIWNSAFVVDDSPYDLRRLWAYQIVVSHFYSNDHIDYVYSADLFRNLMDYIAFTDSVGNVAVPTFALNGIRIQFDSTSSYVFKNKLATFTSSAIDVLHESDSSGAVHDYRRNLLAYISILFSYRRSLRYVDYFTGSRSRPLAVGDVNINVNSNLVNVVDVSRNIQRQRFFNAVNRFGRRFEEYIKGLSGITPAVDYHNPLYLAHVSDTVFGVEVENTGAAQQTQANSITSRFMTNGSRYQFEFEVDRPCVVLGISYYDMPRAYLNYYERQLMHVNRFDMFNPYMQFIGDQDVKKAELGQHIVAGLYGTFGYQLRHMEYKQRYDEAGGGFVESLPGYLFTDVAFGAQPTLEIDPHFIRSLNAELDRFYVALTGYSLGHYFHFIVDNDNVCDASRPMAYAPSIL